MIMLAVRVQTAQRLISSAQPAAVVAFRAIVRHHYSKRPTRWQRPMQRSRTALPKGPVQIVPIAPAQMVLPRARIR
jgi:hypothetical protein